MLTLEASLGELEAVQQRLAENERQIKAQIDELTEELKANQDPDRMQLIQEMISVRSFTASGFYELLRRCGRTQELLGQMSRIQEKASESEAIVKNITKDIQILDLAKKNLMLSMTSLQRLQSLGECTLCGTPTWVHPLFSQRDRTTGIPNSGEQIPRHRTRVWGVFHDSLFQLIFGVLTSDTIR